MGLSWIVFVIEDCGHRRTCGPPTIADFDGDGAPEIGIAGRGSYTIYKADGSGHWVPLWSEVINETVGSPGAVAFDFEGDGEVELIFADEQRLYVWSGEDGTDRLGVGGWIPPNTAAAPSPTVPLSRMRTMMVWQN